MAEAFDPVNRELCPDDMCVGVIGDDGRCRECGKVALSQSTHSRLRGMKAGEPIEAVEVDDDRELCADDMCVGVIGDDGRCRECGKPGAGATPEPAVERVEVQSDIADRELCPDDMCVGVIGPDGRCKECGKTR